MPTISTLCMQAADGSELPRAGRTLAKETAVAADVAKSSFLAAASHDPRQPLQTLTFFHDLLHGEVMSKRGKELLGRAEETLDSMADMVNALLDINQLETGAIRPQVAEFPINDLLDRLHNEFAPHAERRRLGWRADAGGRRKPYRHGLSQH